SARAVPRPRAGRFRGDDPERAQAARRPPEGVPARDAGAAPATGGAGPTQAGLLGAAARLAARTGRHRPGARTRAAGAAGLGGSGGSPAAAAAASAGFLRPRRDALGAAGVRPLPPAVVCVSGTLLTFTNLFPSSRMPTHGLFVYERMRRLLAA